ncbi:MAG: hypothetical protein JEZ14_16895 [Marinilabiliaceae bacterium]|nr:hypothetical protein [Marinilabiliaceae bacterium]
MLHFCRQLLILTLFFTLTFIQCKSPSKTVNQKVSPGPAPIEYDDIGLYEAKIEGEIVVEKDIHYLIIKKILLRGRSVPVISSGDKIQLQRIEPSSAPYNSPVKGTLTCLYNPRSEDCLWQFKVINN